MIRQVAREYHCERIRRLPRDERMPHLFKLTTLFGVELLICPAGHRSLDSIPSRREVKSLRVQSQRPIYMSPGLEQPRLFTHAFPDRLLLRHAVARVLRDKMVAETIFKPGPDVRNRRASRFPFSRNIHRRIADIRDAIVQSNFVVRFVTFFLTGNVKCNTRAGYKELAARDRRRREQETSGTNQNIEGRSLH